jgi:enterochelin esterase-like enzyme
MLEPQSAVFFSLLVVVFGLLLWWMLAASGMVVRVLAGLLAFLPAMVFGVATVNKYYDYYQNWGAAVSDLTNQGAPAVMVPVNAGGPATALSDPLGSHFDTAIAQQLGLTLRMTVHGQESHITRTVYVFLPPQYFQRGFYQKYRFPVVELIHGFPGEPQDWITLLGVNTMLDSLVSQNGARPAVLVIPDANGGRGISLQCLNQHHGPQDATYLARDLPDYIAGRLRVQPPGAGWGIAGYSEGGFCAANLGLQYGRVYNYAGVLSGYFRPSDNQLMNPPREVSPFGNPRTARLNTPLSAVRSLPIGQPVPHFWLGVGEGDVTDLRSAQHFGQLLQLRQPAVTLRAVPRDGHTMVTWRRLLPPMLQWMTRGLAQEVQYYNSPAARSRRATAAAAAQRTRQRVRQHDRLHHRPPQAADKPA